VFLSQGSSEFPPLRSRIHTFPKLVPGNFAFLSQPITSAPAGGSPVSRYFHNAINSVRAKATIPIFRMRLFPSPNRLWYHWLSSLSGWYYSQPQDSCTIIHRTRRFPALLIPCSRRLSPLS
jgi:hypothetical protein